MPKRILPAGLCLLCLCADAVAAPTPRLSPFAQSAAAPVPTTVVRWYAAEVLVFRSTNPTAGNRESWPASVAVPDLSNAIYPTAVTSVSMAATAATPAYAAVSTHGALIANAVLRLRASGRYETLGLLGWEQPADAIQPVSFTPPPVTAAVAGSALAPAPAPVPVPASTLPAVRLDGTARLGFVADQVYLSLNLRLCKPAPPGLVIQAAAASTVMASAAATLPAPATRSLPFAARGGPDEHCFALNQRREVKPGQLNYFDNPVFGALVTIRELKPPAMPQARPATTPVPVPSPASN